MSSEKTIAYRSVMRTTLGAIQRFHEDPQALRVLTPPPLFFQIVHDNRISLTAGEIEFKLWFGPVPVRWLARHKPDPMSTSFVDRVLEGLMALWVHKHSFRLKVNGIELTDHITVAHPSGWRGVLTRRMFDRLPLRLLFMYRHWRASRAVTGR